MADYRKSTFPALFINLFSFPLSNLNLIAFRYYQLEDTSALITSVFLWWWNLAITQKGIHTQQNILQILKMNFWIWDTPFLFRCYPFQKIYIFFTMLCLGHLIFYMEVKLKESFKRHTQINFIITLKHTPSCSHIILDILVWVAPHGLCNAIF